MTKSQDENATKGLKKLATNSIGIKNGDQFRVDEQTLYYNKKNEKFIVSLKNGHNQTTELNEISPAELLENPNYRLLLKTNESAKDFVMAQEIIDRGFEVSKEFITIKPPLIGSSYTHNEKGGYINKALDEILNAIDINGVKPEEIEALVRGKDAAEHGTKSLRFVRPNAEQIQAGLDFDWDRADVVKGYIIGENGDCSKGELSVMKIDDMQLFDSDEEAARQAEMDGVKLIPKKELHFGRDNDMKYYRYIDTPKNRELLSEYLAKDRKIENSVEKHGSLPAEKKPFKFFKDKETGNQILSFYHEEKDEWEGWPQICFFDPESKYVTTYLMDAENLQKAAEEWANDCNKQGWWGNVKLVEETDETQKLTLKHTAEQKNKELQTESLADFNSKILADLFSTSDMKPKIWNYLIKENHTSIKGALYVASGEAYLGDNLRWLIKNGPEEQWQEIREDKKFCEEILTRAENSNTNDDKYTVVPTLELAEKIGMADHALSFCSSPYYYGILSKDAQKQAKMLKEINAFKESHEKNVMKYFSKYLGQTYTHIHSSSKTQDQKIIAAANIVRKDRLSPEERGIIDRLISSSGAKSEKELADFLKKQIEPEKQIQKPKKSREKTADDDFGR